MGKFIFFRVLSSSYVFLSRGHLLEVAPSSPSSPMPLCRLAPSSPPTCRVRTFLMRLAVADSTRQARPWLPVIPLPSHVTQPPFSKHCSLSFHPSLGPMRLASEKNIPAVTEILCSSPTSVFHPHSARQSLSLATRHDSGPDTRGPSAALRHLRSPFLWSHLAEWPLLHLRCLMWPKAIAT